MKHVWRSGIQIVLALALAGSQAVSFAASSDCSDKAKLTAPANFEDVQKLSAAFRDPEKAAIIPYPENCFEALTAADRAFIKELSESLIRACAERVGGTLVERADCEKRAEEKWHEKMQAFKSLHGSAALDRVLIAINANIRKQQVEAALVALNQPKVAPAFKNFNDRIREYETALRRATYKDLAPAGIAPSAVESAILRSRRFFGMSFDQLAYSDSPSKGQETNRLNDLMRAALAVHESREGFKNAIGSSDLPAMSKLALVRDSAVLSEELVYKTNHALDEYHETGAAVQMGASVLAAAGLLSSSAGLAFAGVRALVSEGGQSVAIGAATGFAGGGATVGSSKIAHMTFAAQADANAKKTRLLCELAQRVARDGAAAIRETFVAGMHTMLIGAGVGGGLHLGAQAVGKNLPKLAPLLGALTGYGFAVAGAASVGVHVGERVQSEVARERQLVELGDKVDKGQATRGELVDALHRADLERAKENGDTASQVAMTVGLTKAALQASRGIAQFIDRRTGEVWLPKSRDDVRTEEREAFIDANLNYSPMSVEANKRFIKLAENMHPDGNTRFGDVENSIMKRLNDTTNDKNLVTSLTNRQKYILLANLQDFRRRNPGLEIEAYSDYKAIRFAARGKVPPDFEKQLAEVLARTDAQFAKEVHAAKLIRNDDDVIGRPDTWFRAGIGQTADHANLAARAAREQGLSNNPYNFDDPRLREKLESRLQTIEGLRQATVEKLAGAQLTDRIEGTEKATLSREAFDLTRKYGDPEKLRSAIAKRFKMPGFSRDQAEAMLSYASAVDEFSPGIHVAEREIVNLDEAKLGGFSVDFLGLGSSNQRATAAGLAKAKNLEDAVVQTRLGEIEVTKEIKARIAKFKELAGSFARCSGDDCVGVALKAMTAQDKRDLLNKLAGDDLTRGIRLSFVPEGVAAKADRTTLATHGEAIEKNLRKGLEGAIDHSKLKKAIFAVDMQTKVASRGPVDLIVAAEPGVKWTPTEWEAIQQAFGEAMSAYKTAAAKEGLVVDYQAMKSSCATIAGAAACAAPSRSSGASDVRP